MSARIVALPITLGGLCVGVAVVAVGAAGRSLRACAILAAVFALAYGVVPELDAFAPAVSRFTAVYPLYLCVGGTWCAGLGLIGASIRHRAWRDRTFLFLVAWLLCEVTTYVLTSPFGGARRVIGVVTVATFLAGHLASLETAKRQVVQRIVQIALVVGTLVSLGYYVVDYSEAAAQRDAARLSAARARELGASTIWFTGHWGFQYYALEAGMQQLSPGRTHVSRGDFIIVPEMVDRQRVDFTSLGVEELDVVQVGDGLHVRTVIAFYAWPLPFFFAGGPRVMTRILRATNEFVPPKGPPRW